MSTGSNRDYLMKVKRLSRLFRVRVLGKNSVLMISLFSLPFLLIGCVEQGDGRIVSHQPLLPVSQHKAPPPVSESCDALWQMDEKHTLEDLSYWLRVMECADDIGAEQASSLANMLPGSDWDSLFKQSILLSRTGFAVDEYRQMIERLDDSRLEFPSSLRPLLNVWRQQKILEITLLEERARNQVLQESSNSQIESLRQKNSQLQNQVQDVSRKLQNLTDIERQLSSRKQLQRESPENESKTTSKPPLPTNTENTTSKKANGLPIGAKNSDTTLSVHEEPTAK
jgi:hypothetical protein